MEEYKQFYTIKHQVFIGISLIISVIIKFIIHHHYFVFEWDKLMQIMGGINFFEGNGFTVSSVDPNDFSNPILIPLTGWPPGYSFCIGLLNLFFKDLKTSALLIDFLSISLFFVTARNILINLKIKYWVICLLMLSFSVQLKNYIFFSNATDLLSASLCLYSCFLASKLIANPTINILKLSIVNSLPLLFRYMYFPIVFIIPFYLIWNGKKHFNSLFQKGLIVFLTSALIVSGLILFEIFYKGKALFISQADSGFFPSNLKFIYPFIAEAFINIDLTSQILEKLFGIKYILWINFFKIFSVVTSLFLIVFLLFFYTKTKFLSKKFSTSFVQLNSIYSISILFLLVYLTITVDKEYPLGRIWTFMAESRYYLYITLSLPLLATFFAFKSNKFKLIQFLFILTLLYQLSHGLYFTIKQQLFNSQEYSKEGFVEMVEFITDEVPKLMRDSHIVVYGTDVNFGYIANTSGGTGFFDTRFILTNQIKASAPTIVIIVIVEDQIPLFKNFINDERAKFLYSSGEFYSYGLFLN
jgi:hypothetical protein